LAFTMKHTALGGRKPLFTIKHMRRYLYNKLVFLYLHERKRTSERCNINTYVNTWLWFYGIGETSMCLIVKVLEHPRKCATK
jgi:hypothetical protein